MKCPNCGLDLPDGTYKCMRCGFECKSLRVSAGAEQDDRGKHEQDAGDTEREETVEIDPSKVRMGRADSGFAGGGSPFSDIFGGGIFGNLFGGIFGDFFDPFGGGYDEDDEDEQEGYFDDFGNPMPIDIYGNEFIEVGDIELLDEDGNVIKKEKCTDKSKKKSAGRKIVDKIKDKFKKKDDEDSRQ